MPEVGGQQRQRRPDVVSGQQVVGGHLRLIADGDEVARERADRGESIGPPRLPASGKLRPLQRVGDRDLGLVALGEELQVLVKELLLAVQPIPKGAAHRQVLIEARGERAHRVLPGHGRAISLSRSRSTFA